MLNKRERWAEEGAPRGIQGNGMNQIYRALAMGAAKILAEALRDWCTSCCFGPNDPESWLAGS